MSFPTVVRRANSTSTVLRHVCPKPSPMPLPHTLPPAKMRALIALYHQAENFITPENLSERIDAAFVGEDKDIQTDRRFVSMRDLKDVLYDQRKAPKVSEWDQETLPRQYSGSKSPHHWSTLKTSRELKVIEALYGVDTTNQQKFLPGLEVLLESEILLDEPEVPVEELEVHAEELRIPAAELKVPVKEGETSRIRRKPKSPKNTPK